MNRFKYIIILLILILISIASYMFYNSGIKVNGQCFYKNEYYGFKFKYDCNNLSINSYGWDSTKEDRVQKNYRTFSSKNDYLNNLSYHVLDIDNDRGLCSWKGPLDPPYYTYNTLLCYQLLNKNGKQYIKETALIKFPAELSMNKELEFYKQKVESFKEKESESVLTNKQKIDFYDIFWSNSSDNNSTCTFIPNETNKLLCFNGDSNLGSQLKSILESFYFY